MKRVSRKVVKETTDKKRIKTTTTIHEAKCGCESFECLHNLKTVQNMTENPDNTLSVSEEKTIKENGREVLLKLNVVVSKIVVTDKPYNIIRLERTITEEITKNEVSSNKGVDLKSALDSIMREERQPTANEMNDLMKAIFTGEMPDNIKVMKINGMPSFEEFMDIMKNSKFK